MVWQNAIAVAIAFAMTATGATAGGQSDRGPPGREQPALVELLGELPTPRVFLAHGIDGRLHPSVLTLAALPDHGLEFWTDESFQQELTLVADQQSRIADLIQPWRDERLRLREQFGIADRNDRTRIAADWKDYSLSIGREIDQILLPHQAKRAAEVRFRFYLRTHGFFTLFQYSPCATRLGLTIHDYVSFVEGLPPLREALIRRAAEARDEAVKHWFAPLPGAVREELLARHPALNAEHPSIELLLFQLTAFDDAELLRDGEPLIQLASIPQFNMTVDGTLQPTYSLDVQRGNRWLAPLVRQLVRNEAVAYHVQLSDQQRQAAEAVFEKYRRDSEEVQRRYSDADRLATGDEQREVLAQIGAEAEAQAREMNQAVRELFEPDQWNELEKLASHRAVQFYGPLADVLGDGPMASRVTPTQKEQFVARGREAQARLEQRTREIEQATNQELIRLLPEHAQQILNEALGEPLRHTPASIELLLLQLTPRQ